MIVIGSLPNLSHLIFYISKSYDRESSSVYGITFKLCDFGWILNKKYSIKVFVAMQLINFHQSQTVLSERGQIKKLATFPKRGNAAAGLQNTVNQARNDQKHSVSQINIIIFHFPLAEPREKSASSYQFSAFVAGNQFLNGWREFPPDAALRFSHAHAESGFRREEFERKKNHPSILFFFLLGRHFNISLLNLATERPNYSNARPTGILFALCFLPRALPP